MKKGLIVDIVLLIILIICVTLCVIVDNEDNTSTLKDKTATSSEIVKKESLVETKNDDQIKSDDDLISYVEDVELRVNEIVEKEEVNEKDESILRSTFITLTDFIFYDGEIKGKKFSDITESCKAKIIDIYTKIDQKIESKYPNYKENIKETTKKTYHNAVDKAKEVRDKIINKYRDYVGEEKYNYTVDHYEDGKQDMKDVYDVYEPYIEPAKEKVKSGASKIKEKVSEWYRNYKENGD